MGRAPLESHLALPGSFLWEQLEGLKGGRHAMPVSILLGPWTLFFFQGGIIRNLNSQTQMETLC